MKKVTLSEFAELAKNDKALDQKILEASKKFAGGSYRDGLKTLAAELGYDLTLEDTSGELEMLSEYDLEQVSGGWDIPFCEFLLSIFGMDSEWYCEG